MKVTTKQGGLLCGCIVGEFECPEAVRLWREVNYQYGLLKGQPSTFKGWKDYDKALSEYRQHKAVLEVNSEPV